MPKHFSKSKAIHNMLGRLGFHAKPSDVVAALREYGIEVSAGLVQKVKMEILKDTSGVRRQKATLPITAGNQRTRIIRKIPVRRAGRGDRG